MSDLIVLAFANEADALKIRDKIFELKQERLVQLIDAVSVVKRPNGKLKVKHEIKLADSSAENQGLLLDFAFWMFYQQIATSPATNAPSEREGYMGVDDKFVKEISRTIELSDAVLFLLATQFSEDRAIGPLQDVDTTLLKTSLSKEDEAVLMAVFGR
jgi:uncharacterized membrane protein